MAKNRRPRSPHPDLKHWIALREVVLKKQRYKCGTCDEDAVELHHRTYINWGLETERDVIALCVLCHEAISRRFRLKKRDEVKQDWLTGIVWKNEG